MKALLSFCCSVVFFGITAPVFAAVVPIDLNDFYADPTVAVAVDGGQASFTEDPPFSTVILSNDPFLGDPVVVVADTGISIAFEFDLRLPTGNLDEFGAFVIDVNTGLSFGTPYEFFTTTENAGTVMLDISSLIGQTLGFQFQLSSLPGDSATDATLTVSNLRLVGPAEVPEPSILMLMSIGLFGLVAGRLTGIGSKSVSGSAFRA